LITSDSKSVIAQIENEEKEKTGIKTLKVGYNKVFGYYVELSKSYTTLVPDYYIRKQTIANGERYIIPKLKEIEETILTAQSRLIELEYDIFNQIRIKIWNKFKDYRKFRKLLLRLMFFAVFQKLHLTIIT
jgi:DNA mismatch repair protein MutS